MIEYILGTVLVLSAIYVGVELGFHDVTFRFTGLSALAIGRVATDTTVVYHLGFFTITLTK